MCSHNKLVERLSHRIIKLFIIENLRKLRIKNRYMIHGFYVYIHEKECLQTTITEFHPTFFPTNLTKNINISKIEIKTKKTC